MIVLKEQGASQEFKIIPRELVATTMNILDEAQGTDVDILITPSVDRYYLVIDAIVTLIQDRHYILKVFNGSVEVYRDRIFCTNQVVPDYSVNDGEYKENPSNNDFIII